MYLEPIEHPDITRACETGYPWSSYSGEDADTDEPSECDDCDYDICEECRAGGDCFVYDDDGELEYICDDCPYGEGGEDNEDSGRGQQDE